MKETSRRWRDAGITLATNPSAQVLCPQCEAARLTVTDAFAGDCMERWMRCPACGANNTLLPRRTPRSHAATPLERAVIEHILSGEHPVLGALREQWAVCSVSRRELTGVGSYTTLLVPPSARALSTRGRFTLSGANVTPLGREEPIGSVLFVDDGKLDCLEMFMYSTPWPADTSAFSMEHAREPRVLQELEGVEP